MHILLWLSNGQFRRCCSIFLWCGVEKFNKTTKSFWLHNSYLPSPCLGTCNYQLLFVWCFTWNEIVSVAVSLSFRRSTVFVRFSNLIWSMSHSQSCNAGLYHYSYSSMPSTWLSCILFLCDFFFPSLTFPFSFFLFLFCLPILSLVVAMLSSLSLPHPLSPFPLLSSLPLPLTLSPSLFSLLSLPPSLLPFTHPPLVPLVMAVPVL